MSSILTPQHVGLIRRFRDTRLSRLAHFKSAPHGLSPCEFMILGILPPRQSGLSTAATTVYKEQPVLWVGRHTDSVEHNASKEHPRGVFHRFLYTDQCTGIINKVLPSSVIRDYMESLEDDEVPTVIFFDVLGTTHWTMQDLYDHVHAHTTGVDPIPDVLFMR